MDLRLVDPATTAPLRRAVLRPHFTLEEFLAYPDTAQHVAVFLDDRVVACASVQPEPMPDDPRDGDWRLRGMASDPEVRGQGYGAAALTAALDHVRQHGGRRVWCNARTGAIGFYERHGFQTRGEEYDLPDAGPHYFAYIDL